MSAELNHTIVWARDKQASAEFLAGVLGLPVGEPWGPFVPVELSNGVTLDYHDATDTRAQHYAFLIDEVQFDAVFARIRAAGLTFYADPGRRQADEIPPLRRAGAVFRRPGRPQHGTADRPLWRASGRLTPGGCREIVYSPEAGDPR